MKLFGISKNRLYDIKYIAMFFYVKKVKGLEKRRGVGEGGYFFQYTRK